jgi:hypothetical protein
MSNCNLTQSISGTECIGDSLVKINNNFSSLDTVVCTLSTNIVNATPESPLTTLVPFRYKSGCTLSNSTINLNTHISISPGLWAADTSNGFARSIHLANTIVKNTNSTWSVGNNAGGYAPTEAKPVNGTVHVWLISTGTITDVLFSNSATSPTMPIGYTLKRRIGSVLTDGVGNIRNFIQQGDEFILKTRSLDRNYVYTGGTTAVLQTLSVPTGIRVMAKFNFYPSNPHAGSPFGAIATGIDEDDIAPTGFAYGLSDGVGSNTFNGPNELTRRTNTNGQIRLRASANIPIYIATAGWIDLRE